MIALSTKMNPVNFNAIVQNGYLSLSAVLIVLVHQEPVANGQNVVLLHFPLLRSRRFTSRPDDATQGVSGRAKAHQTR
ncbi:hypothetical protein D3C79_959760 [compost metagenome]